LPYFYIHWFLHMVFGVLILCLLLKNADLRYFYLFYERLYDIPPEDLNYRWDIKKHVWVRKSV
jgi:hypothetical protein